MTPIFKTGKAEDRGNYRAVSLTYVPDKVRKQMVLKTMLSHMEKKGVFGNSQHDFPKGKSYPTNLVTFYDRATALVNGAEQLTLSIWVYAKCLTLFCMTSLSLNWREVGLMDETLGG